MAIILFVVPLVLMGGVGGALAFASQETEDMSPSEQTKRLNVLPVAPLSLELLIPHPCIHVTRGFGLQQSHFTTTGVWLMCGVKLDNWRQVEAAERLKKDEELRKKLVDADVSREMYREENGLVKPED